MPYARLRALTQDLRLFSAHPELVEMAYARLRALTQLLEPPKPPELLRRNGIRPLEGIDTPLLPPFPPPEVSCRNGIRPVEGIDEVLISGNSGQYFSRNY